MYNAHQKRIVSWIAIFAILLSSFAPVVSHTLNFSNASFAEVCTSQGIELVQTNDTSPQDLSPKVRLNHCSYCTLVTDKAYLPVSNFQLG